MPSISKGVYKWLIRPAATLDDFADRLNHFWTVVLLLLCAAIINWRQTYMSPIKCWLPAEFKESYDVFAETTCWNSYLIKYPSKHTSGDGVLSKNLYPHVSNKVNDILVPVSSSRTLYQGLPLILCFQALLFKLPAVLMYILHSLSGTSFDKLAGLTEGYGNLNLQERSVLCQHIGRYLYNWCRQCENCLPWRQLTLVWLFVKFLYCVNIITQLSLVDSLLTPENTTSFGDVIAGNLFQDSAITWRGVQAFPKTIVCHFDIIRLRGMNSHYSQCTLHANYFSEFVYMFLWVWLLFVAVVTCSSLLVWLLKILIPVFRKRYIKNALALSDNLGGDLDIGANTSDLEKFCDLIGEDGVMALKLTESNSSPLMVGDIVRNIWHLMSRELNGPYRNLATDAPPSISVHSVDDPPPMYPSLQTGHTLHGGQKMD